MAENPFRDLPSVATLLGSAALGRLRESHGHDAVADAVRRHLDGLRDRLRGGESLDGEDQADRIAERVAGDLARVFATRFRTVINATGIVLHTNLGRSPLAAEAVEAAADAARGYVNLELDLDTGDRRSRQAPVRELLAPLLGCESATAVNNCAAATVIVLRAFAAGREVIVSRGQLVEIGGGFRIPEIMAASGAILKEVGTTNITRIEDYERAITTETALLMRIHASNFRQRGHVHSASLGELVDLGRRRGIPVVDDVGSGAMTDFAELGLPGEPVVGESIAAGADLVLFSGDKLFGGPQAGLIVGRADLVARIERDPMMRAMRLDKMTLAALVATLRLYGTDRRDRIPVWAMLSQTLDDLRPRAEALAHTLRAQPGWESVEVRETTAFVGGGSLPDLPLPTVIVAVRAATVNEDELALRLRTGTPAVLARIHEGCVCLDLRTVLPGQDGPLAETVAVAAQRR